MPHDVRKIILSTNIAEASVTIDDVKFVVDTGKMKEKNYDVVGGFSSLKTMWISKSNATQRRGRAGRTSHGMVFRCYSKLKHACMEESQRPEILRSAIHEICLNCKPLAPADCSISEFLKQCPEPPDQAVIDKTLHLLKRIEALDETEELTELGQRLVDLPVSPQLGKVLLHAVTLKCLDPILIIVASVSNKDPFNLSSDKEERDRIEDIRKELAKNDFSDHLALLEVCCKYLFSTEKICKRYNLSNPAMRMMNDIRGQLYCVLVRQGLVDRDRWADVNVNSTRWPVVKAALVAGLYPHVAVCNSENNKIKTGHESNVRLHPSVMFRYRVANENEKFKVHCRDLPSPFLIYNEMNQAAGGWSVSIRGVTCVSPMAIALFGGASRLSKEIIDMANCEPEGFDSDGNGVLVLDDNIAIKLDALTCSDMFAFRQQYQAVFLERMMAPNVMESKIDKDLIELLCRLLEEAETAMCSPARPALYNACPYHRAYIHRGPPRNITVPPTLATVALRDQEPQPRSAEHWCSSTAQTRDSADGFGRGKRYNVPAAGFRDPRFGGAYMPMSFMQNNPVPPYATPPSWHHSQSHMRGFGSNRDSTGKSPMNGFDTWTGVEFPQETRNKAAPSNRVYPLVENSRQFPSSNQNRANGAADRQTNNNEYGKPPNANWRRSRSSRDITKRQFYKE